MSADVWETLRADLAARLPQLMDKALASYADFASTPPPDNPKDFTAFQASCRAALAHVHLLIKLAHWARTSEEALPEEDAHIARMIEEAEEALGRYPLEE